MIKNRIELGFSLIIIDVHCITVHYNDHDKDETIFVMPCFSLRAIPNRDCDLKHGFMHLLNE